MMGMGMGDVLETARHLFHSRTKRGVAEARRSGSAKYYEASGKDIVR